MKRFNDFVEEQLQDEEFRNEYENIQPELDVLRTMIEKTIQRQDTSICDKENYRTTEEGYDMCKAVEDMRKECKQIGEQIGSNKINLLNEKLMTDNRFEDLKRSITDRLFQQQLMAEYRIGQ